jgi:hypothetical protein
MRGVVGTGRQKRQRKARQEYIEAQMARTDLYVSTNGRSLDPKSPEARRLLKKRFAMMTDEELGFDPTQPERKE